MPQPNSQSYGKKKKWSRIEESNRASNGGQGVGSNFFSIKKKATFF